MKSYEKIREIFEEAMEERLQLKHDCDTPYLEGVVAALGWVLEKYAESPLA